MGVKCNKCGEEFSDTAKFCGNCGAALLDQVSDSSEIEGQEYDGPWRLTDVVREWLKEMEWEDEPEVDSTIGNSTTSIVYVPGAYKYNIYFETREPIEVFLLFCYCPVSVPKKFVNQAKEFVNQINCMTLLGHFQLALDDDGDGVFRYVHSIDVEDLSFETTHIRNLMVGTELNMELRVPQLEAICKGKSVADVLAKID